MSQRRGSEQFSRRSLLIGGSTMGIAIPAAASVAGIGAATWNAAPTVAQETPGEGVRGGQLKVALYSELPTMDMPFTAANIVGAVIWNIFEPLFVFDGDFALLPMLAASHAVSEDGLTHTIALRTGVLFHDGNEMVSQDVVASIERWGRNSGFAANLMKVVESIATHDDYTIEIKLSEPFGTLPETLAMNNGGCPIYPKAICDAAGDNQITEFIGTGPYRFVERQADRFIRLERFEDYSALDGEPNGYGGHKYAYVDKIEFVPVPDQSAQVAGLKAGDYQYVQAPVPDQIAELEGASGVIAERTEQSDYLRVLLLNWASPVLANEGVRQAIQARIDCESVLIAAYGEGSYHMNPGVMFKETPWHSTADEELFNRNDPEAAKALLESSGYDGTPIRLLTIAELRTDFNMAATIKQQLEEIGITIDLQSVDNPTAFERWGKIEEWDMFPVGFGFKADPIQVPLFRICNPGGGWCNPEASDAATQLSVGADFETRYAAIEALQQDFYEHVGAIKLGDTYGVQIRSDAVKGQILHTALGITFWNMWLDS